MSLESQTNNVPLLSLSHAERVSRLPIHLLREMVDSQLLPVLQVRSGRRLIRRVDLERIVSGTPSNAANPNFFERGIELLIDSRCRCIRSAWGRGLRISMTLSDETAAANKFLWPQVLGWGGAN